MTSSKLSRQLDCSNKVESGTWPNLDAVIFLEVVDHLHDLIVVPSESSVKAGPLKVVGKSVNADHTLSDTEIGVFWLPHDARLNEIKDSRESWVNHIGAAPWIDFFQVSRNTGVGTSCARRAHESIDLLIHLLPNFGSSAFIVGSEICFIVKLVAK